MSIQAESENYDTDVDYEKTMRKQVLSTAWTPPVTSGFAVGILVRNEVCVFVHFHLLCQIFKELHTNTHMQVSHLTKVIHVCNNEIASFTIAFAVASQPH